MAKDIAAERECCSEGAQGYCCNSPMGGCGFEEEVSLCATNASADCMCCVKSFTDGEMQCNDFRDADSNLFLCLLRVFSHFFY